MDIYSQYQEDGNFEGDEGLFYILAGEGGAARKEKNGNYYIITRVVAGVYDISAASMVKRILVATWPISCEEYAEQKEENGYLHRFAEGVIYKVKGRLQYKSPAVYLKGSIILKARRLLFISRWNGVVKQLGKSL